MQILQFELTSKEIETLCKAGAMAPSGGNTQPWLVEVIKNTFSLKLNPNRATSFLDVEHYASFFGLGCFLENILVEARSLGLFYETNIEEFVSFDKPLVTVKFTKRDKTKTNSPLQPYLEKRITNRHIYNGSIIDKKIIKEIKDIFTNSEFGSNYGIQMLSSYDSKQTIASILGKADAIRMVNDEAFKEMMQEFRWTEKQVTETKDGLDLKTLELPGNVEKLYILLRNYDFLRKILPEKALQDVAKPLLVGCSHISCLYVTKPLSSRTMLTAGMLFERLWLTAAKLGIALQPWSVSTYFLIRKNLVQGKGFSKKEIDILSEVEKKLAKNFAYDDKIPVMIFRLSLTNRLPSAHSIRIPWEEFTKISV